MSERPFVWDESLYAGSAAHYARGRMPYPAAIADALASRLGLDGTGRLLDLGSGPGSLTLLLAGLFAEAVGVDADADMVAEGERRAGQAGVSNVTWRVLRAEELPAGLGTFRLATVAQSFHWMDQLRVATTVRDMLEPGGAWAHVGATTHRGIDTEQALPHPAPPWAAIQELVERYLGPVRRAGRSTLPSGTRAGEDEVMRGAGYVGPERVHVGGGEVVERSTAEVIAAVFSLSSAAPHLFGDRLANFERDLRSLLHRTSPDGRFCEVTREVTLSIWRP